MSEENQKLEKKQKAQQVLMEWKEQRTKEIGSRSSTNQTEQQEYMNHLQRQREGPNPWERVIENCEMNSGSYVGSKDVTRMR